MSAAGSLQFENCTEKGKLLEMGGFYCSFEISLGLPPLQVKLDSVRVFGESLNVTGLHSTD